MSKIILLGYMAAGKSTVGREIAEKLKIDFYDLDSLIEKQFGQAVNEIFSTKGELSFRKEEKKQLEHILNTKDNFVLSLGGGTPLYYNNADMIFNNSDIHSVYLKASLAFLVKRLFTEKESRPLISHLKTKVELEDFVRKHLFERHHVYDRADNKVMIDDQSPHDIADKIINALGTH